MSKQLLFAVMAWGLAVSLMSSPAQAITLGESGIEIGGSVDVYYSFNFDNPPDAGPLGVEQAIRAFDTKANEFSLSLAELTIQKSAAPVGFRVDLVFGPTADLVHAFEFLGNAGGDLSSEVYKNILQAYVTYTAPIGNGLTIDFGKFVTHIGNEVIESQGNWNYSRGILFTWAIPFYHAGVRVSYPVVEGLTVTLLGVNGWNNVEENNDGKSIGAQIIVELIPNVTIVQNAMWGAEIGNRQRRDVYDTIVQVDLTDQLSVAANFDIGRDDCIAFAAGVCTAPGNFGWYGFAGYGRYAFTDQLALAVRGEWFQEDGFAGFVGPGVETNVAEVTVTGEWKISDLLTRLEYRRDWSNRSIFVTGAGGLANQEDTITLGAVYTF